MQSSFSGIILSGFILLFVVFIIRDAYSKNLQQENKEMPTFQRDMQNEKAKESSHAYVKGITAMRARSLVGVALSLSCLIIGLKARKRSSAGMVIKGRKSAMVSIILGAIAFVISVLHLMITSGAVFGSGSGKAGAIVAISLSLLGISFSTMGLRQRKA